MAHSLSAKKRIRQNERRRARNRGQKRQVKLSIRAFSEAAAGGDTGKTAEALRLAARKIDQSAAKGTIPKNTAGRRKARLQRQLNAILAKA